MEQDRKDRAREPDGAGAAAEAVAGPVPGEAAVVGPVPGEAAARVPDSRARAGDRVRETAEGEEIPTQAGEQDAGGDSAEAPADAQAEDRQMPGMDGTGPMGTGPTGWGRGPCGRGLGRGRGMGRGLGAGNRFGWGGSYDPRLRGNWFGRVWGQQYPGSEPTADRAALEEQVRMLESDLQAVRQQLEAMGPAEKE